MEKHLYGIVRSKEEFEDLSVDLLDFSDKVSCLRRAFPELEGEDYISNYRGFLEEYDPEVIGEEWHLPVFGTLTSDGNELRGWYDFPSSIKRRHVDSMGIAFPLELKLKEGNNKEDLDRIRRCKNALFGPWAEYTLSNGTNIYLRNSSSFSEKRRHALSNLQYTIVDALEKKVSVY